MAECLKKKRRKYKKKIKIKCSGTSLLWNKKGWTIHENNQYQKFNILYTFIAQS